MSEETDFEYAEELSESGEKIGIEKYEDDMEISEPFDPESISIEHKIVPMDTLIRRLKQKSIRLAPKFQRKEVWNKTLKSRLIESIMLKIPLPMFYVAADENGNWEVVDGLQRLSTIRDFIIGDGKGNGFFLENLEFLGNKFNDKTFFNIKNIDAMQKIANTILETEMRFIIINPKTSEEVKRNIFKRINTGGMPLTPQEIRHALYQGKSSDLLEKLAGIKEFKDIIDNKNYDSRMAARELILWFISFSLFERSSYKPTIDTWLSNAMRVINITPDFDEKKLKNIFESQLFIHVNQYSVDELESRFIMAINRGYMLFEKHAFRKSSYDDRKRAPINKALFEVWSNILCDLTDKQFKLLYNNKDKLIKDYKEVMKDADFSNSISKLASNANSATTRYKKILKLINKFI